MVFDIASKYQPEQIVYCNDEDSGLRAIIVIHDSTFGPGAGGTRMYDYPSEDAALIDALRLAQGMTRKCAIAQVGVPCTAWLIPLGRRLSCPPPSAADISFDTRALFR